MNHSELIARLRTIRQLVSTYRGFGSNYSADAETAARLIDAEISALQALERVPMTDAERQSVFAEAYKTVDNNPEISWRDAIVDKTEAHHGITPPESKG